MFGFSWKRWRRRRILKRSEPPDWQDILAAAVRFYRGWPDAIRQKFSRDTKIFLAEKHWEGCDGLELTDEIRQVIAAQAAMMLVGMKDYCFEGVETILVYPASFRRKTSNGLVVSDAARSGEAWHRGPIVLSWQDVQWISPGRNVVVHELAHHLDGLDGEVGGSPMFVDLEAQREWETLSKRELEHLERALAAGQPTFLDPYAATHPAEFFAVACETFFEDAPGLRDHHPELFACLTRFFQLDPSRWSD